VLSPRVRALLTGRRTWGIGLQVVPVIFAVVLAVLGSSKHPPSAAVSAVIVLVIAGTQVGAGWLFSTEGKADPTLAERSVGRLVHLATRAQLAEQGAQAAFESNITAKELHAEMGKLSVELSWLGDGLVEAVDDWRMFHPQAVERAERGDGDA
jgi:hypothetical protein